MLELEITYGPGEESENIARELVLSRSPELLNKWAIHYFKMSDKKQVKGKMVSVDPSKITTKDNIRYINHIFNSFGGSKLSPFGRE